MTADSILDTPTSGGGYSEYLQALMHWHFSPETGARFWLEKASTLGFDPCTDISSFEDLSLFPDVVDSLRDVPVEDLIPAGYTRDQVIGIFDSGGTTGAPKRIVLMQDFCDVAVSWLVERVHKTSRNWLAVTPTGPHIGYEYCRRQVAALGGLLFSIDLDPRWVKRVIGEGRPQEADAYAEHLIDQAAFALRSQDIGVLITTPPLLARIAQRDELIEIINDKVEMIYWGGARMDPDTRDLYRTDIFPDVGMGGSWGSTMALGLPLQERPAADEDGSCVFDSCSPYVIVNVVDPETRQPVAYGERGQLQVHCLTKSFLLPNNLERDYATRVPVIAGQHGDAFADVTPMLNFGGREVIEGVY